MSGPTLLRETTSLLPSPSSTDQSDPLSPAADSDTKRARIEAAIEAQKVSELRSIAAESGGFESRELRARVW